jgi:hypothetical protein
MMSSPPTMHRLQLTRCMQKKLSLHTPHQFLGCVPSTSPFPLISSLIQLGDIGKLQTPELPHSRQLPAPTVPLLELTARDLFGGSFSCHMGPLHITACCIQLTARG